MGDDSIYQHMGEYNNIAIAAKNLGHDNLAACMLQLHTFDHILKVEHLIL
uniref:Uncharacterized protein n=1 Tax=Physcomitrium patens TaxID=3218 RepID=A0A2K1KD08_PHYPA|nr:hypothetical protein PHYPA_010852 [Physcomitrium patens]